VNPRDEHSDGDGECPYAGSWRSVSARLPTTVKPHNGEQQLMLELALIWKRHLTRTLPFETWSGQSLDSLA
jgi:hypothetical protein